MRVAAFLPASDPTAVVAANVPALQPDATASPTAGALHPMAAWVLLACAIGGTLAAAARAHVLTVAPSDLPKAPEVLAERARALLVDVGHGEVPVDSEFWFATTGAARGDRLPPVRFVYRQSSRFLLPGNLFHLVTEDDPPTDVPGMATVALDPTGRLVRFAWIRDVSAQRQPPPPPDWPRLFREAGLDEREFVPADSDRTVVVPHDQVRSWQNPTEPSSPIRVTAASLGGAAVLFEVNGASSWPAARRNLLTSRRPLPAEALMWTFIVLGFAAAGALARRNLRAGEGDRVVARKLAILIACGGCLFAILRGHHVPAGLEEVAFLLGAAGWALVWTAFSWLAYIAFEPYVRRWWPAALTSWTRLFRGRVRDPLVGRDVLLGVLAGLAMVAILALRFQITGSAPPEIFVAPALESVRSPRHVTAAVMFGVTDAQGFVLGGFLFLVVLRLITRNPLIAIALWILVVAPSQTAEALGTGHVSFGWDLLLVAALGLLGITLMLRLGLLAAVVALTVERLMTHVPMTLDPNVWYAGSAYVMLLIVFVLAVYGFVVALGGRPAFGGDAIESPVRRYS